MTPDGRTRRKLEDAPWLTAGPLPRLLDALDGDGEEARVVGGAVRNALLGMPITEIDVATTALPEEVLRRVNAARFKAVPTGIEHGTVTVIIDGRPFEVTTLRQDVETFGRHARVAFGRDWRTDAERRDFTINALSLVRDGTVYDYVGGLDDLAARRVRFIGDPKKRIEEDYLRILRFFRFHASYATGDPDAEGVAACIAGRDGLDRLSRERVRMEMMKLVVAPRAAPTLVVMSDTGLLQRVLGGIACFGAFGNIAAVESAAGLPADPVRRLGALAVAIPEDAERLWQKLRLSNTEYERLAAMADGWWRIAPATAEQEGRVLLYRLGPVRFVDRVLLAWARSGAGADDARWRKLADLPQRWTAPAFPIRAADLMARGVPRGRELGRALRTAEEEWIASGFPDDQAALQAIAARAANQKPDPPPDG